MRYLLGILHDIQFHGEAEETSVRTQNDVERYCKPAAYVGNIRAVIATTEAEMFIQLAERIDHYLSPRIKGYRRQDFSFRAQYEMSDEYGGVYLPSGNSHTGYGSHNIAQLLA